MSSTPSNIKTEVIDNATENNFDVKLPILRSANRVLSEVANAVQTTELEPKQAKSAKKEMVLPAETEVQHEDSNLVKTQEAKSLSKIEDIVGGSDATYDIDEGHKESSILVSAYANDIYKYLVQLEDEQPIYKNHLADQQAITPETRAILLNWINELHSEFNLFTDTYHMTVGIIDRYLQQVKDTEYSDFQLVGLTALLLATKFEERHSEAKDKFFSIIDNFYNRQQFHKMEMQIFKTLDFNLSRPLSIQFLRRFVIAADVDEYQYTMSKYFLELATIEYDLASCKPSEIAAASLFLCLHVSKGGPNEVIDFDYFYWNETLEFYSQYNAEHLLPIARKIATLVRHAPEANLKGVYTKYQSLKFYTISLYSALYSELMDSIIGTEA